jgi:hypothetical protein
MHRLVVNPNTPQAWEIQLKQGENFLGRGFANDFKFHDASVSSSHCRILINEGAVVIKDLGSTNGTFVNHAPVQETSLENGQAIRLGSVEMMFHSEVPPASPGPPPPRPAAMRIARAEAAPTHAPDEVIVIPSAPPRPAPLRISAAHAAAPTPPPLPPPLASPMAPPIAELPVGPRFCKFHPKSPARFLCNKCNRTFCDLCVTSLRVGHETKKSCRTCGVECVPLELQWSASAGSKGFFARLPGAFAYPFRGAGVFVMIVGLLIFIGLKLGAILMRTGNIRSVGMGVILEISAGGYLFTYLQSILFSTANEDRELPSLPGVDNFLEDVLQPFFRLLGLAIVCFGPAIGLVFLSPQITILPALIAQLIGYVYFPMAFLSVAILDSVAAANPLLVVPSMFKAPLEYFFALVFICFVNVVYFGGGFAIGKIFSEGFETRSMGMLFGMIGSYIFLSLISLYLLLVAVHILGLIYVAKKEKLGWLDR